MLLADQKNTPRFQPSSSAEIWESTLASGVTAKQLSFWAKRAPTWAYSVMAGAKEVGIDTAHLICRFLPFKWVKQLCEYVGAYRGTFVPIEKPSFGQMDRNHDGVLCFRDVHVGLLEIDEIRLNTQKAISEKASLESQLSAVDTATEDIADVARILQSTVRDERFKLNGTKSVP